MLPPLLFFFRSPPGRPPRARRALAPVAAGVVALAVAMAPGAAAARSGKAHRRDGHAETARQPPRIEAPPPRAGSAAPAGGTAPAPDANFERLAAAGPGPAAPGGAAAGAAPAAASPPNPSPPPGATDPAGTSSSAPPPAGAALTPSPPPPAPKPAGKGRLVAGAALAGLGVVTGGIATYHFIWNSQRYDRWAATDLDLASAQSRSLPDFQSRQEANNALADAIARASRVTVVLAATAGALVVTGVVLVLTAPSGVAETAPSATPPSTHALNVGLGYVEWRASF